jgi:adenosylcobyric acid synthase
MLGTRVADPQNIEGPIGELPGLGLLNVKTTLTPKKKLVEVAGKDHATGTAVRGYEMHVGETSGADCDRPMLELAGRPDGAVSADGRVMGCYMHGIFASDAFRRAYLKNIRPDFASDLNFDARVETTLDALADHLERHVAIDRIWEIANAR